MIRPLRIGSLFSGIGGLELGIQRGLAAAGVPTETIWQVEQNDYARAVLARHWPHAERYTDVRNITAATVAPVDLLCGGFPCQDISTAGKGAGLAGERSGLFFEMARIIRELRPKVVVMENVPAITTRGLDTVLGTLASCGYAAKWGMLRADDPLVGAPHRRERWFCVAWLADTRRGDIQLRGKPRELGQAQAEAPQQRAGIIGGGQAWTRLPAIEGSDLSDPDRGDGSGSGLAHTDGTGRQEQQPTAIARGVGHDTRRNPANRRAGVSESEVGRGIARIPARLDMPHRWPAPPGPQHAWETPRTRPRQPHDRDRLKALGNSVVPQCAEIIGRFIGCELLELK